MPTSEGSVAGLFGPQSMSWRVNREAILLLGGGRALLLQLAHPLVAAGVAEHSNFKEDPLGRLRRTLEITLTITFGTVEEAEGAARLLDRIHARVAGRSAEGVAYSARDPVLQFWVHATLIDTALEVYERFVEPLEESERERYYQESKQTARLFGISEAQIPEDLAAFRRYMRGMLEGDDIRVTDIARDLAASILRPPIPLVPSILFEPLNLVTAGLLPPRVRRGFDLNWSGAHELLLGGSRRAIRGLLPFLPDLLRAMPPARVAARRLATQRSAASA